MQCACRRPGQGRRGIAAFCPQHSTFRSFHLFFAKNALRQPGPYAEKDIIKTIY
ncbi:hypothetical protein DESPIG_03016 [Desulfovibrio piger ATCC 29098]|uniref:Uncharacterized protein n=1 Tax=Desulfovibrio piger ATCC 29098 TaxID=411464 RepID=B6WY40_9BACT|nr:hypothetical protein DESPIG_03016 [Desulfovibrio piger ATCC 29098]